MFKTSHFAFKHPVSHFWSRFSILGLIFFQVLSTFSIFYLNFPSLSYYFSFLFHHGQSCWISSIFFRTGNSVFSPIFEKFLIIHNGENDSHKRQFLALGVCSQSWKSNNLSRKFLSNWLVLQAACYNLTEKHNIDCKVSNLRIKIADKRGQLALIY